MQAKKTPDWEPLTVDLSYPQVQKIELARQARGLRSASDVVRLAISEFDIESFAGRLPRYRQISVRIDPKLRERLRAQAKKKNVSVGELLREALKTFPAGAKSVRK